MLLREKNSSPLNENWAISWPKLLFLLMFFPLRNGLIKSKDYKAKEMWGNQKIKMNCCAFVDQNWNPKTRINKIFLKHWLIFLCMTLFALAIKYQIYKVCIVLVGKLHFINLRVNLVINQGNMLLKSNEKSSCLRQKYRKELVLARHVMKRAPVGAMSKVSRRSSKKHPKNILKACYVNFL